jgi:hypothetical protein
MRLWLLKRRYAIPVYDCNDGFVIRAGSEVTARFWASQKAADEGPNTWIDTTHSTCEPLEQDGESGVILIDFNAG